MARNSSARATATSDTFQERPARSPLSGPVRLAASQDTAVALKEGAAQYVAEFQHGYMRARAHQYQQAIIAFRKVIELKPDLAEAHNNLAWALGRLNQFNDSIIPAREAIALNPNFALAHCNLGFALSKTGQYQEAVAEFHKTIELDPGDTDAHYNLGWALGQLKQFGEAAAAFRATVALKPSDVDAHRNLGWVLSENSDFKNAIAAYQAALRLKPDYAAVHFLLGVALGKTGQFLDAASEFRKYIEFRPEYQPAYYNLGWSLAKGEQFQDAIVPLRKAIELDAKDANAHGYLGLVLAVGGGIQEALAELRIATDLSPNSKWAEEIVKLSRHLYSTEPTVRQVGQQQVREMPDIPPTVAKDEVVRRKRKSSLLPKYEDKVEISGFVPLQDREDLKAIAAAKDMGIVDYVGELVSRHVAKNQHLVSIGKEKLKKPKRYKTKRMELEQEVKRLRRLVKNPAPK